MDIQLLEGLGRAPIPGSQPAGTDVRADARFEALQDEIAKLTTPGAGVIDWNRVAQLGGVLLAEKGKDLLVASYVGAAATQQADLPGLVIGLEIMADLVEQHWEAMSPPLARLRGRRNAVQWLLDRLDQWGQDARWEQGAPVPATLMQSLQAQAARLDEALRTRDEESPSLRPLRQWLDRLPVEEPAPAPAPVTAPVAAPTPPSADAATPAAARAAAPSHTARAVPVPPPLAAPDGDLEQALTRALEQLNPFADLLMDADPYDPRAYRLGRFANWAGLQQLPPATDGRTHLPPPISQVVDAWARVNAPDADADAAVRFAEAQLPAFPLWLDLQSLSASALARLGQTAAQHEVEAATRALLARLPGLEALSFSSGMPFANGETLTWLAGLGSAAPSSEAGAGAAPARAARAGIDSTVAQARSLAANGELDAAVALLQKTLDQTSDAAQALQLRTRLCLLLSEHLPGRVPGAFADELLAQVRRHELAHWDPALALDALAAAYRVLIEDEARQEDAAEALRTVARLDAARALQLVA